MKPKPLTKIGREMKKRILIDLTRYLYPDTAYYSETMDGFRSEEEQEAFDNACRELMREFARRGR